MQESLSQAQFARRLGVSPAHVTRLKQAGRLVMVDGRVLVEQSRQRIDATGGVRPDVADRHAQRRKPRQPAQDGAGEEIGGFDDSMSLGAARDLLARSKARREAAMAEKEELERDALAGRLVERSAAERAMRDLGAQVRAALETYADQVAPLVAPIVDLNEVHAVLAEQCRNVLVQVGEALRKQQEAMGRR